MSKKSTGLQSWGEINIASASKLGQHNKKQILIWRTPVSAPRLNASVFGRSQGGEMAPTFLLYHGYTRHMDWEMFWTSLAGDEFVVGQMVLNCWKNISPAYISCTNTGKIRACPWQERGEWDALQWLWFSGYSQRIHKAGEEIPAAPEQQWPQVCPSPCGQSDQNCGVLASSLPLTQKSKQKGRRNEKWWDLWTTGTHHKELQRYSSCFLWTGNDWVLLRNVGSRNTQTSIWLGLCSEKNRAEGGKWSFHFSQTRFHSITEWFGFNRTLKIILFHLLPWIGTLSTRPGCS